MISIRQHKDIRRPKIRLVPATPMAVNAYKTLAAGKQKGLPLCTNRKGGRLYDYGYWLIPAIKESGVEDFTPKDLRHTAASRWVMSGVPIVAVVEYLGHSTIEMTVMRYSHLISIPLRYTNNPTGTKHRAGQINEPTTCNPSD
jgi:integrase